MKNTGKFYPYLIIAAVLIVFGFIHYYLSRSKMEPPAISPGPVQTPTEKSPIEKLSNYTGKEIPVPEELRKKLSAPEGGAPISIPDDVIKSLTVPAK